MNNITSPTAFWAFFSKSFFGLSDVSNGLFGMLNGNWKWSWVTKRECELLFRQTFQIFFFHFFFIWLSFVAIDVESREFLKYHHHHNKRFYERLLFLFS